MSETLRSGVGDVEMVICTWCDIPATSRCSACHQAPFCSTECQKECWPVHKFVCAAEPDVFRQAPLSLKEMTALDGLKHYACDGSGSGGPGFDKFVQSVCKCEPSLQTWEDVGALLVGPVTALPTDVAVGIREALICYARVHLGTYEHYSSATPLSERVSNIVASPLSTCIGEILTHSSSAVREKSKWISDIAGEACRQLYAYLHESIWSAYALALLVEQRATAPIPVRSRWYKLLNFHLLRQRRLACEAHVDPAVRSKLEEDATARVAKYAEMARRGGFGTLEQ